MYRLLLQKRGQHLCRDIFIVGYESLFDIVTCSSVGVITTCPFVSDDLFCPYNACIPLGSVRLLTENVRVN